MRHETEQAKPRPTFTCAQCRCGKHGADNKCSCCSDCFHLESDCRCYCPPRGVLLSARQLREMRKDIADRDHNTGAPFWTERVGALLDHIEILTSLPGLSAAAVRQ